MGDHIMGRWEEREGELDRKQGRKKRELKRLKVEAREN